MKYPITFPLLFLAILILQGCNNQKNKKAESTENKSISIDSNQSFIPFGVVDGQKVNLFKLKNKNGMVVKITNYGGIITSIIVPDNKGKFEDVVLGYDSLSGYLNKKTPYFGAVVGRYGNRIAKGKFTLDGKNYSLAINNKVNHLHGGIKGFDKVVWRAEEFKTDSSSGVKLTYLSKDMEEGYPGNLNVNIKYTLSQDNALRIDYEATSDKNTVINLTNHSYFNLSGNTEKDILNHQMQINSNRFLPIDSTFIPTGKLQSVEGTPFDFRKPKTIGDRITEKNKQIEYGGGFDHCWVLNKKENFLGLAAIVDEPQSGRKMEVFTTEPGVQFYTGNFLDGTIKGKNRAQYKFRSGLCLETEHFPDSPNQKTFPSVVLKKGEVYRTSTIYKYSN